MDDVGNISNRIGYRPECARKIIFSLAESGFNWGREQTPELK